jgi:predicted N-formylglutamate amidohydrolase
MNLTADPSPALLAPDEPCPVIEANATGPSPFFLTCDHYGRLVPRVLGDLGVSDSEWQRHIAWDIGIAGVVQRLSKNLDAHLIAQRYSRLVIDCNRPPGVPSSIPIMSEATAIPGNEGLSQADAEARRIALFQPYHDRITQILDQRAGETRPTILLAMHSFTPVYAGVARPWHIGTLYNRDKRLAAILLRLLHAEGDLVAGDNQPYAASDTTDYAIPVHAERRGLVHTGIEIRQDLIADESGQRECAERLTRVFTHALEEIGQLGMIVDTNAG